MSTKYIATYYVDGDGSIDTEFPTYEAAEAQVKAWIVEDAEENLDEIADAVLDGHTFITLSVPAYAVNEMDDNGNIVSSTPYMGVTEFAFDRAIRSERSGTNTCKVYINQDEQ